MRGRACAAWVAASLVAAMSGPFSSASAVTQPATAFDFNGDSFADLAVGVPGDDVGDVPDAGAVQIIYGSVKGLRAAGNQLLTKQSRGIKGTARQTRVFGTAIASGDFDRDGYADLAVGASPTNPEEGGAGGEVATKTLTIVYGSRSGLSRRDQLLPVPAQRLAAGDFNGDGFADLVAGDESKELTVLHGTASGISTDDPHRITVESPGLEGASASLDDFGRTVAVGDVTGDSRDDIAFFAFDTATHSSLVYFLRGSASGLDTRGSVRIDADTPGLAPEGKVVGETFGEALAIGDFDGDRHGDLAVGDSQYDLADFAGCQARHSCTGGVVHVLPGSVNGPESAGAQFWTQASPTIPGRAEIGDGFGSNVAAGDLNGDKVDDLVVSAIFETVGKAKAVGAVTVIYGSHKGLQGRGAQSWSQNSRGIKGTAEDWDNFGDDLQVLNVGGGAANDLAVGVWESIGKIPYGGAVSVLYGSTRGLTSTDQLWHQNVPGIPGRAEPYDAFGTLDIQGLT
jgi:hypothetical protein